MRSACSQVISQHTMHVMRDYSVRQLHLFQPPRADERSDTDRHPSSHPNIHRKIWETVTGHSAKRSSHSCKELIMRRIVLRSTRRNCRRASLPVCKRVPGRVATLPRIESWQAIGCDPLLGCDRVKMQQGSGPESAAAQHRGRPAGQGQALLQTGWLPGLSELPSCLA